MDVEAPTGPPTRVELLPVRVDDGSVLVSYRLTGTLDVELAIFDVRGRRVRRLADGVQAGGVHARSWDGTDDVGRQAAGGVYFVRLVAGGAQRTQRLVLVR